MSMNIEGLKDMDVEEERKKAGNFKTPEPGIYLVRIDSCVEKTASTGNLFWSMQLSIEDEGEFYSSRLFDKLFDTPRAAFRKRLILEALKIDLDRATCEPEELIGKYCKVMIDRQENYKDKNGLERIKACIAFDGYYPVTTEEINADVPFA